MVPTLTLKAVAPGLARQPNVLNVNLFSAVPLLETTKLKGSAGDSLVFPEKCAPFVGLAAEATLVSPRTVALRSTSTTRTAGQLQTVGCIGSPIPVPLRMMTSVIMASQRAGEHLSPAGHVYDTTPSGASVLGRVRTR